MTVFVDTSAIYALIDQEDGNHDAALEWLDHARREADAILVTHNYVVIESVALVQSRLGIPAVRNLIDGLLPVINIHFVDENLHGSATRAFLASAKRKLSLVDWISFEMMRDRSISQAFAFDRDFAAQGFKIVP